MSGFLSLLSLPLFLGLVLEALNRSLSFFPREKALFISYLFCVLFFFVPALKSLSQKKKDEEGGNSRPVLSCAALCSAAYLRTFYLQSLFKEREMLLISFYCFHLSPLFLLSLPPFSFSAHSTLTLSGQSSIVPSLYCIFVS